MENDKREKIRQNLPKLIETTICSNMFLAFFASEGIFCKSDEERIKTEQRNYGDQSAAAKFYDVLITKKGSYETLLHALLETKQSGTLNLLSAQLNEKPKLKVLSPPKFVKAPSYIEEFMNQEYQNTLVVISEDCDIICQWILDKTPNCKLLDKFYISELESLRKGEVAVINVGESLDKLQFIAKDYEKKAILVTAINLDDERFTSLKKSNKQCKFVQGNLRWSYLTLAEKDKIITGLKGSLNIDGTNLTDALEQTDTRILASLIRGRFPSPKELISETIPKPISYYIPRTLVTRNVISERIFQSSFDAESIKDLFLFSNIERHVLSKLVKNKLTDTTGNLLQSQNVHTPFLILEHDKHYYDICKSFVDICVHHFNYEKDQFIWFKTNGSISIIQKYISYLQHNVNEMDFLSEMSKPQQQGLPICISDTAGMGKSILLVHLATILKKENVNGVVAFAVISELVSSIKSKSEGNSQSSATTLAIQEHVSTSKLGRAYLQVNTDYIHELFLDGLDEIDPDEMDFALNCIKELKSVFKNTRIWITTRPHMLQTLETEFSILGYNLAPFSEQDQVEFLKSFWSTRMDENQGNERIADFASHCLKNIKTTLNLGKPANENFQDDSAGSFQCSSISSTANDYPSESKILVDDIAGVPLQCLLIGEVYEEDVKLAIQDNTNTNAIVWHDIQSIPDLYSKMVDKKFANFKKRYDKSHLSHSEIEKAHIKISVEYLFPAMSSQFSQHLTHTLSMQQVFDVGIIESQSVLSPPRFIHRTFAEYFVASFFVQLLCKSKDNKIMEFLVRNILRTEVHEYKIQQFELTALKFEQIVIVCFLNNFLETHKASQSVCYQEFEDFEELTSKVLSASLYHNFESIFNLFLNTCTTLSNFDKNFFDNETLVDAVYWAKVPLLKTVIRKYGSIRSTPIEEIKVLNHVYGEAWYNQGFSGITCSDDYAYWSDSFTNIDYDYNEETTEVDEIDIDEQANKSHEAGLTLLHIAVHRGNFAIVEYLLANHFHDSVQENTSGKYDNILHICVEHTISNSDYTILERTQIIKLLGNTNLSLFTTETENFQYPIECEEVHLTLVKEMWKIAGNLYKKNAILDGVLLKLLDTLKWDFIEMVGTIFEDVGPTLMDQICRGRGKFSFSSFLNMVFTSNAVYVELLDFLKNLSASFCLAEDRVSVYKIAHDESHGSNCINWLIQNVPYTTNEFKTLLWYSIKNEYYYSVDGILKHMEIDSLSDANSFCAVFAFIFGVASEPFKFKKIRIAIKMIKYFVSKKFPHKPVDHSVPLATDYEFCTDFYKSFNLETDSYFCLENHPSDLDKFISHGLTLLSHLETQKHMNCVECYFVKCLWISYNIKKTLQTFADHCKKYLGLPELGFTMGNGNSLLEYAAKYFCDTKISETFLSLSMINDMHLSEKLLFNLISYISQHKKIDFWMTLVDVYGIDLGISRYTEHIPLGFLTSHEQIEVTVMAVLNAQLDLIRQGKSTILNIFRIVYLVIKTHNLNIVREVCAWCIRSCKLKNMSFSDIRVFFDNTAYTILDAAIESLNGDVLQYVYTALNCKITLITKTKVPSYIHGCLSNVNLENNFAIGYVEMLAIVFPKDIKHFLNQPNDNGLVPLASSFIDEHLVSILVRLGANVNFKDEKGNTPLHYALLCDTRILTVKELVKWGADVYAENQQNETPLLMAVKNWDIGSFSKVDFMLENNFNLAKTYSNGNTIIHLLATNISSNFEFQNLVECLISKKCLYLLQVRNHFKKTPLQLVEENINFSSISKKTLKAHRINI